MREKKKGEKEARRRAQMRSTQQFWSLTFGRKFLSMSDRRRTDGSEAKSISEKRSMASARRQLRSTRLQAGSSRHTAVASASQLTVARPARQAAGSGKQRQTQTATKME